MFIVGDGDALRGQLEVGQRRRQSFRLERFHRDIDGSLYRRRAGQRLDVDHVDVDHHAR